MKHLFPHLFLLSAVLLWAVGVWAAPIEGVVLDPKGEPVIGASIAEPNSTHGTITDIDGHFQLDVAAGKQLVVSYVGYRSQTIRVAADKTVYTITLQEDVEVLDDVVVIGYGTQKRSDVTGSISSVSSKEIADFSSKSLAESLQACSRRYSYEG